MYVCVRERVLFPFLAGSRDPVFRFLRLPGYEKETIRLFFLSMARNGDQPKCFPVTFVFQLRSNSL
jgi:hypothetical protein